MTDIFIISWNFIFKIFCIFNMMLGITLTMNDAEKALGIINNANMSHPPDTLTMDTDSRKNIGIINNAQKFLLVLLNENTPTNNTGKIIGNKK